MKVYKLNVTSLHLVFLREISHEILMKVQIVKQGDYEQRSNWCNYKLARKRQDKILLEGLTGRCPSKDTVPSKYTNEVFPQFQQIMS